MTATETAQAKRIAELEALLASKTRALSIKAGAAGGLSVYGMGRFPTTLFANQWVRLIEFIPEIKNAIAAGQWKDKNGTPIILPAGWIMPTK